MEVVNTRVEASCDNSMQTNDDVRESENLDVEILADWDSYWQDINDRLTVSRMVSDSVIKGMVTAVTEEAAENIAQKELEVAGLKEMLHVYRVAMDEKETVGSLAMEHESKGATERVRCSFSEAVTEHDRMKKNLGSLRNAGREQLMKLKKEINQIRECSSIKRIGSNSELGLGGILHENSSERWYDMDKTLDSLKTTLETVYKGAEDLVHLSKTSLQEWKQEQEFQAEIEALVMGNCIRSLEQEFEETLWDRISGDKGIIWYGRMKEFSSIREALDVISKSLCISEAGHLISHGSLEGEAWSNGKMNDTFHHRVLSNHVTPSHSISEENGKLDELQASKSENSVPGRLKHMSKDELVVYYNNEMTTMKRNHESKVQEMTEDYFSLKREYLKEKGSSSLLKKDKEFDMLRKKIPEVILKLDGILAANEKLPVISSNAESLSSLKDRMEIILAENRQLRESLTDKKKEVKRLSRQVSDAVERMGKHSLSEAKLLNTIRFLKSAIEDLHIEASIGSDVFTCLLNEITDEMKCIVEGSLVEYNVMRELYESVINEVSHNAQHTSQCIIEDSDVQPIIMQGLSEVIFRESWKEAKDKLSMLNMKYIDENEVRVSLEKKVLETEKTLETEVAETERLKLEILAHVDEKEKLAQDAATALQSEKERFQSATEELEYLRLQICQQQTLISKSSNESDAMKGDLAAALKELELYKVDICKLNKELELNKVDICKLNKELELASEELREANEERSTLLAVTQEKQNAMSLREANDMEVRKQMESIAILVNGLSKAATDFEHKVIADISKIYLRLKNVSSQSRLLIQKANILRRTGLLYKQRLDRRCSDLQKAEAEVDLLGDEVDTLLSLLEKIYIALDHYSPILQHYPGIIEILKLVKRELNGESARPV
ncbi:WPP domain-associated protein [Parasponia andersonii]|uniref:WPP domain-associated protein n=1 Tax=Parasponia andersonii TaxID=3476 RepID=A0A2P5C141_PARAD|nr:WPP domain-associated protein [Parasponia andersonii]